MTGADQGVEKIGEGASSLKDRAGEIGESTGADKASEKMGGAVEGVAGGTNQAGEAAGKGAESAKEGLSNVGETTGISKGAETVTDAAGAAGTKAQEVASGLKDGAGAAGGKLGEGAQAGQEAVSNVSEKTGSNSDEFEIDSDVSDEDLLLLKGEIKRTKSTKTQRDLATATIELQKLHRQRWER
ncbi:MAG: hypothetical protein Q9180_002092 [Flavoplaca navasiana]